METQNGVPSFKKKKTCPTCFRPRKSSVFLYPSNFRKKKETNSWVFPKIGVPPPKSSVLIVGFCMIFIFSPSILGCNSLFLVQHPAPTFQRPTPQRNWCQETGVKTTLNTEVKNLYISSIEMKPGDFRTSQPEKNKKTTGLRNPGFLKFVHSKWISKLDSRWTRAKI